MERGNKEKILEMIKAVDKKTSEMEDYISNLSILSSSESVNCGTLWLVSLSISSSSLLNASSERIANSSKGVSSDTLSSSISALERVRNQFISYSDSEEAHNIIILLSWLHLLSGSNSLAKFYFNKIPKNFSHPLMKKINALLKLLYTAEVNVGRKLYDTLSEEDWEKIQELMKILNKISFYDLFYQKPLRANHSMCLYRIQIKLLF